MILVEKILEILQLQAEITVDLFDSVLCSKPVSYQKMRRSIKYGPREFKTDWADAYRRHQQFYKLLNYMRREGLIENKRDGRVSVWNITKLGLNKLRRFKKQKENPFSVVTADFDKLKGRGFTIVAFDIPEKERKKRDWIRGCLKMMDFNYLQKSVWFGKGKIDEEFIHALRKREMLDYVHIFSINSIGTIRELGRWF